jgi:hypothetical protein
MHNDKFGPDDGCASGHRLHSPRARRKTEAVATYIENSAAHAFRRLSGPAGSFFRLHRVDTDFCS